MPEVGPGNGDEPGPLDIVVLTPSWNRRSLLPNLYESLATQTDSRFEWVVVDDGSADGTSEWLDEVSQEDRRIRVVRNELNVGKCASLNRGFDAVKADFYLIVDSDDTLLPHAIQTVRSKIADLAENPEVGAIFFSYRGVEEHRLRSSKPFREGLVISRADFNDEYGKFDGCVGYFLRVVEVVRYPEYAGETYVGPTVLQLRMAPTFGMSFTWAEIGIAHYQASGLTAGGRRLRVANPRGMMEYSRLQGEQAASVPALAKNAILYEAYRSFVAKEDRNRAPVFSMPPALRTPATVAGRALAAYWRRRYP